MKVSVSICKRIKCSTLQNHVPGLTSNEGGPLHFHCHHLDILIYRGNYLGLWLDALEFHLCLHSLLINFWGSVLWSHDAELPHYKVCKLKYKSRSTRLWLSEMTQLSYSPFPLCCHHQESPSIWRGQLPYFPAFCELLHLYSSQAGLSLSSCWKLHVEPNIRPGRTIRSGSLWLGSRVRVGQDPTSTTSVL